MGLFKNDRERASTGAPVPGEKATKKENVRHDIAMASIQNMRRAKADAPNAVLLATITLTISCRIVPQLKDEERSSGGLLSAEDFEDEQAYHGGKRKSKPRETLPQATEPIEDIRDTSGGPPV